MEELNSEEKIISEMELEVKTVDCEGKALKENEIMIIGSTPSTDRDGEAIDIKAWDLTKYKNNPVILAQHDYSKPPIGKATSVKKQNGKLVFKVQFPEEGINPEADVYRKLTKAGFLNTSSVGFIPKKWTDGNGKSEPYRTFTKVELLELSLVSVPANPEALVIGRSAVKKGVISEKEAKLVGLDTEVKDMEEKKEEIEIKSEVPVENVLITTGEMMKRLDAIEANFNSFKMFVEGFIAGQKKLEEPAQVKDFITEILKGRAERTDSSEELGLKDEIKQLIKGE